MLIALDRYSTEDPGCFGLRVGRLTEPARHGLMINVAGPRNGYTLRICVEADENLDTGRLGEKLPMSS